MTSYPTVTTWNEALQLAGTTVRTDVTLDDATDPRQQTLARTYSVNNAWRILSLHKRTLNTAIADNLLTVFVDPEDTARIPAEEVEAALEDDILYDELASTERIDVKSIASVMNVSTGVAKKRLKRAGLHAHKPYWYQIRNQWNLPGTLSEFRERARHSEDDQSRRKRERAERKRQRQEAERQRRNELRAQLVASFPAWADRDRSHQLMMLHIGPPNSGKTHDALNRLANSGHGWYLAPLRLLAWEVYDRLNERGVPCNLLTGEEYIPVEGAQITAATIEMFNANDSGECVIIDEAQMLADPDRGWAWTRAMMQCRAAEMHIIAPETARSLIQQMAQAANIPVGTVEHERLTPIRVADHPWQLENLPGKTILVAFSRKMVLTIKTRLEKYNRNVSVVYGSLPPEVRRKQAERFASGDTDICVATDAVGMGLNLPADYVCFYEIEKYDGREVRQLKPAEVQQIGGRAGRYGFSQAGEVGAMTRKDLNITRRLFYAEPETLTHARVAPSVDDLALIPGNLAEKLREWSNLHSIPRRLRDSVTTADMSERIELASMLRDEEVEALGLAKALQLVNAPTRRSTRDYWYDCAQAILGGYPMPLPPSAPDEIQDTEDLEYTETCISASDIYLWLGYRNEFNTFASDMEQVKAERQSWSQHIDDALLKKIRTSYLRLR